MNGKLTCGTPFPGQERHLEALQRTIENYRWVRYVGEVDGLETLSATHDVCLCLPQFLEPFGVVALEAWSHGTRVVGLDVEGAQECLRLVDAVVVDDPSPAGVPNVSQRSQTRRGFEDHRRRQHHVQALHSAGSPSRMEIRLRAMRVNGLRTLRARAWAPFATVLAAGAGVALALAGSSADQAVLGLALLLLACTLPTGVLLRLLVVASSDTVWLDCRRFYGSARTDHRRSAARVHSRGIAKRWQRRRASSAGFYWRTWGSGS